VQVTIELPDDIATELKSRWGDDLPRGVLETIAVEGYRSGELTHAQVMRLLGFRHRLQVEAFLKDAGADLHYDEEELARDRRTSEALRGR
jgi:predicted HTH domain antitoxin